MSKLKWAAGAAVIACTSAAMAYAATGTAGAATTGSGTGAAAPAAHSKVATQTKAAVKAKAAKAAKRPPVLSGKRQVTIVRAQAFESAVSMVSGELTEVDDDSGRQLFVPTPVSRTEYIIKAYGKATNDPASLEPSCWQVSRPGGSDPLRVEAAACDKSNARQRFHITAQADKTYAIDSGSAYLQYSPTRGLILEELGDAPLLSTFRLVDNGPAPRGNR
ncbi:hypothetical protein ACPCHT_17675 [Nucisporomicrobium flavum]|uniref:hypothetical protein n=1 Tax=Nucisporomicrobium flavum TaxID=2785915 RepID=UPI003C2B2A71